MKTVSHPSSSDRCVACQVGQGKSCPCRRPLRLNIGITQFWWTMLIALTGFWGVLLWRTWEAFK